MEDHCEAIHCILTDGKTGETYAVGGDNQPTNLTLIKQICDLMDEVLPESPHTPHAKLIALVADRPGHDRRYDMDISKIRKELGWQPRESLASGLKRTIDWYVNHPEWLNAIREREDFKGWEEANYKAREVKS